MRLSTAGGCVVLAIAGVLAACGNDDGGASTAPPSSPSLDAGMPAVSTPEACVMAYPAGPYGTNQGDVLADATLSGIDENGSANSVALHDAHACGAGTSLLVLRVSAGFCGSCRWHGENLGASLAEIPRARVRLVDVLVRNDDGEPPAPSDLAAWRAHQDLAAPIVFDSDDNSFVAQRTPLPRYLVVDPQTMKIAAALDDPAPETLHDAIAGALATVDVLAPPAATPVALSDGRFNREQMALLEAMTFTGSPPPDPTNRFGDDGPTAVLGKQLFSDETLSPDGLRACSICHEKARALSDGAETATGGVGGNDRNTPSIVLAAWARWQMWDGRADTLWMQALLPMEASNEFGSSRLFVAHRVYDAYKDAYQAIFGPLPPLDDTDRFPPAGMPGDAAYDAMPAADQDAITQVFVNIGKSIAAFERRLRPQSIPLESYLLGEPTALTDDQKDGVLAFFQAGCATCHWGNRLTDDAFHVMRFPTGRHDLAPDPGRSAGIPLLLASDFLASGRWSDAPTPPRTPNSASMLGAFKTPGLRGVALTAPYGHGGSVPALSDAIELHRTAGMSSDGRYTTGTAEPWIADFSEAQAASIVTFLGTMGAGDSN